MSCLVPHVCVERILSWLARYLPARGLDREDRRLRPGHSQVPVERLTAGGAAQRLHLVDGESTGSPLGVSSLCRR